MLLGCMSLCGCFGLGTTRLYEDQLGYSRALGDAEKSDTLLNVVRLRYADTPIVLQATQVISGYQLQRNVTGGFEAFPAANPSTFLNGSASAQLQQSPTFTFQPLSGAQFAQSFIRPLSPADLLPLAMGGLPIDVLFRLGVQSINGLSNAVALTQTGAAGSPDFFLLLQDLRRLQIAGLLSVRLQHIARPQTPTAIPILVMSIFLSPRHVIRISWRRSTRQSDCWACRLAGAKRRSYMVSARNLGRWRFLPAPCSACWPNLASRSMYRRTMSHGIGPFQPWVTSDRSGGRWLSSIPAPWHQRMSLLRCNIAGPGSGLPKTTSTAN